MRICENNPALLSQSGPRATFYGASIHSRGMLSEGPELRTYAEILRAPVRGDAALAISLNLNRRAPHTHSRPDIDEDILGFPPASIRGDAQKQKLYLHVAPVPSATTPLLMLALSLILPTAPLACRRA